MKILVLGWYGTETIGDRAIFAGLLSFFFQAFNQCDIFLGSLNPFFSERTLDEDNSFYKQFLAHDITISLFDSTHSIELDHHIRQADLVVMGGGPLMHIDELYMIEYAFKRAKLLGKKSAILGCGIGPLFNIQHKKAVLEITQVSDLIILRDSYSKEFLSKIYNQFNLTFNNMEVKISIDPSFEAVRQLDVSNTSYNKHIALNLRSFPNEYSHKKLSSSINNNLYEFVKTLSEQYSESEIQLVPMHYFHIGNDDRLFLNEIALKLNKDNLIVQNKNLSLQETMLIYQSSLLSIGMRFHSVLLQTLLNGKNFILDYTEPDSGKINSFINDIDTDSFYQERHIKLQRELIPDNFIKHIDNKFVYSENLLLNAKTLYVQSLKDLKLC